MNVITSQQKYNALKDIFKTVNNNQQNYQDAKDRILLKLETLCTHRNIFSRAGLGPTLPDSLLNAVVQLIKLDPDKINTEVTEQTCIDTLYELCIKHKDYQTHGAVVNQIFSAITDARGNKVYNRGLFDKVITGTKGLFVGAAYQNLNYINHAAKNANSKHNALLHQQAEVDIAIDVLTTVLQIGGEEWNYIPKNNITLKLRQIQNHKLENLNDFDDIANKNDWDVHVGSEKEKLSDSLKSLLKTNVLIDKKFATKLKEKTGQNNIDNAIKALIKQSQIKVQKQELITAKIISKVQLTKVVEMESTQTPLKESVPSIIRGNRHIFQKQDVDAEPKNSDVINMSTHTIKLTDKKENFKTILCGHIDTPEAADTYIKQLAEQNKGHKLKLDNENKLDDKKELILIDNRLMYDTSLPKGEAALIRRHREYIDKAVDTYNTNNTQKIKFIHLNLPARTYLGMNKQDTQHNRGELNTIYNMLKNNPYSENNGNIEYKRYELMLKFLERHKDNEDYYCGENGHKIAFAIKYLCNQHEAVVSGGCKSAKDRASAQKLFDEVYYALLMLKTTDELDNDINGDFFNTIPNKYLTPLQNIVIQNGMSEITRLNTTYAGNKNFGAINNLLDKLGFKDKTVFKGQSSKAKS